MVGCENSGWRLSLMLIGGGNDGLSLAAPK